MAYGEGRGSSVEGPGHSGFWIVDCGLWIWGKVKGEYRETKVEERRVKDGTL